MIPKNSFDHTFSRPISDGTILIVSHLGQLEVINFYNITSKLRVGIDEILIPY